MNVSVVQFEREKMANTVDNIYNQLKSSSSYSGLSDDQLYDIANELSKKSMYFSIDAIFSSQIDPLSPFYGENSIWAKFTFTEIIQMEEQGVLIPKAVLSWAHSMQDADTTDYQTSEVSSAEDPVNIEQEVTSGSDDKNTVTLNNTAKQLVEQCKDNQNQLDSQIDNINSMKKDVEDQKTLAEDIQTKSLNKIQNIVDEWQELESKLKRGIPLSETEQQRFDELNSLLNNENKQYQKEMDSIDLDFDAIANSLNEIDKTSKISDELSEATELIGKKISQNDAKHKFTNTSANGGNYTGVVGLVMSSSIAQSLAESALDASINTDLATRDIQTDVNEIAALMDLSEKVTGNAQTRAMNAPAASEEQTQATENEVIEGAENEVKDAENSLENKTTQTTPTATSSQPAPQTETSAASTGNAGITETSNVSETSSDASVENDTLGTDNSEEAGNDLKTRTQEQIEKCNTRSSEITNAVNEIDPLKKAVEDIQKESRLQDKIFDAKVAKSMKEYETLCNKMKNGEQLSSSEQTNFEKLTDELDKENGNYVKGLNEKINTLSGYTRSLNYAMDIVNQGFDIANAAIETGKQLAISELGDRSYLMKTFYFALLNDERQKDLLYGKVGESLGREAIQRGDVLNLEAADANTLLSRQIPLSNFAQEHAGEITDKKNTFVEKVTAVTKDVPGVDPEAETDTQNNQKTEGQENANSTDNSEQTNELSDENVESMGDNATQLTAETEEMGSEAEKSDEQALKDAKYAEATHKKFQILNKKEEKKAAKTGQQIEILNENIAQEVEKLVAATTVNGTDGEGDGAAEQAEAINIIKLYGNEITVLQSDSIKSSQKLRSQQRKEAAKVEKAVKSNEQAQEQCSKFEEIVSKTDKVMSWVTVSGIGLEAVGVGLIVAGNALLGVPFMAGVGAAMIAAGTTSFNVGKVTETIGVLGSVACKVTKAGIAIADGDILGALKNLAMAGAVVGGAMLGGAVGLAMQATGEIAGIATGMIDENKRPDGNNNEENNEEEEQSYVNLTGRAGEIQESNEKRRAWAMEILNRIAAENEEDDAEDEDEENSSFVEETTQTAAASSSKKTSNPNSSATAKSGASSNEGSQEIDASNGKQAAKDVDKEADGVENDTQKTEKEAQEMEETDKEAQKSDKKLQKDSKALEKDIKKNQKDLQKNEKEIEETSQKIEEEAAAVDALSMQLDTLNAEAQSGESNNAMAPAENNENNNTDNTNNQDPMAMHAGFSVMNNIMAGSATTNANEGMSSPSNNQAEIETVTKQIDQKTNVIGIYSNKITKVQKGSDKIIKSMNTNTKKYNKAVKQEQKEKQEDQSRSEKVLETATKIEGIASKVAMTGFVVGTTGDVLKLVILPPWIPAVGAVMAPIGHAAEAIGNYGVAAANVTKMATYAAQGNLLGALMSAGMAIMSGASAVSATGQAVKGFQNMGKNIAATQARAATYQAAKEGAKAAVTATGEEGIKQSMQKVVSANTAKMMKQTSKKLIKNTLKEAGKKAMVYAGTAFASSQQNGKQDNPEEQKEKSHYNIVLSDHFKEIQRKNKKRRQYVNQRYGIA